MLELLIENPPKRKGKGGKKRKGKAGGQPMAKKKKRGGPKKINRRNTSPPPARTSRRRRRGGLGGNGRGLSGLLPSKELLMHVGGNVAGYYGARKAAAWAAEKFDFAKPPTEADKIPWGVIGVKAATGMVGGLLIGKFAGKNVGYAFAAGAMADAAIDAIETSGVLKKVGLGDYDASASSDQAALPSGGVSGSWDASSVSAASAYEQQYANAGR